MSYNYWIVQSEFTASKENVDAMFQALWDDDRPYVSEHMRRAVAEKKHTFSLKRSVIDEVFSDVGLDLCWDSVTKSIESIAQNDSGPLEEVEGLLMFVAPWVDEDSYINCAGDDYAHWRWRFKDKELIGDDGIVVYDHTPHKTVGDGKCPIKEMAGIETCKGCPFGLICLTSEYPQLDLQSCSKCGGEVVVRLQNDTTAQNYAGVKGEIIARLSCTCESPSPKWGLPDKKDKNQ